MIAFLVVLLAALSRLLPHAMHAVGINFTAVGAGLLFFGSRRPRWQAVFAALIMALTDVYLTTVVYGMTFHVSAYLITWVWYGAVALLGSMLIRRVTVVNVAAGVVVSASGFFLLSNLVVWYSSGMYPHTTAGLSVCYAQALPFYGNDLVSTGLFSTVLFGVPALATYLAHALRGAHTSSQPLA